MKENTMESTTEMCWVCDREKPISEMVFSGDRYICDTKECLLGAFEMVVEGHQLTLSRLELIRNS